MSVDAYDVVTEWLKASEVAPLVTRFGKAHIYQGAPDGAPYPAVILYDAGTTRAEQSDVGEEWSRISFSVKSDGKAKGKEICKALIDAIDKLARSGAVVTASGRVSTAVLLNRVFRFDPVSNKPEYLVDVRFIVTT